MTKKILNPGFTTAPRLNDARGKIWNAVRVRLPDGTYADGHDEINHGKFVYMELADDRVTWTKKLSKTGWYKFRKTLVQIVTVAIADEEVPYFDMTQPI